MNNNTSAPERTPVNTGESNDDLLNRATSGEYKYGFTSDIDTHIIPKGLNEDVVRLISSKKGEPEWLLEFRLKAFRYWQTLKAPDWAYLKIPEIDFQDISYYAEPVKKDGPKSLDEVDPQLLDTFNRLGIPLEEQKALSGMAVDAVMDSVSVKTTHREKLAEKGIIFCSISEAVKDYPDLVKKYLGSVVPYRDNFYAALNSAVFSDGSFVYIPKGVRCPMELSTYFRINASGTGQFERTLIVADDDAYVSYLEGCTAPMRDENQLHAAIVEIIVEDRAEGKILDRTELVCRRCRRTRRRIQLRDKTRTMPRRPLQTVMDTGGDRLSHHLEISVMHTQRRLFARRVLLGSCDTQSSAGRHRHQDDTSRQELHLLHSIKRHIGRILRKLLPRARQSRSRSIGMPQLHTMRLPTYGKPLRGPYLPLHRHTQ